MARRQRTNKEPPNDSQFGQVEPIVGLTRRSLVFVFGAAFAAPFLFFSCAYVVQRVAEKTPPVVTIVSAPSSVATEGAEILFDLADSESGLRGVGVVLRQGTKSQQIFAKSYQGEKSASEKVVLKIGPLFQEGKLDVLVTASDQSIWKTAITRAVQLYIDRTDPRLTVVNSSTVSRQGEAGALLYKLVEANLESTGVLVGDREFASWPVASITSSDAKISDLFLALYPVPENTEDSTVQVTLFARDMAGRESNISIQRNAKPISNERLSWDISDPTLFEEISQDFNRGEPYLVKKAEEEVRKVQAGLVSDEEIQLIKARLTASFLRPYDIDQLAGLVSPTALPEPRIWKGPFQKPVGAFASNFGSIVTLEKNGAGVATFDLGGRIIEVPPGTSFVAALAPGKVSFTGMLGTLGNIVVLDHGLGVSTVYAGLGSVTAVAGNEVKRRDRIGIIGRSGLLNARNGYLLMAYVRGVLIDVEQLMRSEKSSDSLEGVLKTLRDGVEK